MGYSKNFGFYPNSSGRQPKMLELSGCEDVCGDMCAVGVFMHVCV